MHFHAHLRGDERHAFNSHKYGAARMPFPVLVISCLSSNFNKQFQVNCLCVETGEKKKLLQSVFIYLRGRHPDSVSEERRGTETTLKILYLIFAFFCCYSLSKFFIFF